MCLAAIQVSLSHDDDLGPCMYTEVCVIYPNGQIAFGTGIGMPLAVKKSAK